jgi:hypothetical protein
MKTKTDKTNRADGAKKAYKRSGEFVPSARYAKQPLKPWQLTKLSLLAKQGFDKLRKCGAIECPQGLSESAWFKQWKQAEQGRALGAGGPVSLKDCKQAHVRTLETWFDALAGRVTERTFERALRSEDIDEQRRQMIHHIEEEAKELNAKGAAVSRGYAEVLCNALYKRTLDEADPVTQLPNVLATMRQRAAGQIRKANR